MSELSKPGAPNVLPDFSTPLAQAGSDIARRFYEQSQVLTDTVTALNGEICQFISHRLVRDGEAVGSMTKCQSLPDIVAIQSKWFQDAADDYLNEMGKLMDVNSKFIGNMLGSIGDSAMQGPPKTQKPPTNTPAPVREQKVSEAVS